VNVDTSDLTELVRQVAELTGQVAGMAIRIEEATTAAAIIAHADTIAAAPQLPPRRQERPRHLRSV
jgi:hypothetical protein